MLSLSPFFPGRGKEVACEGRRRKGKGGGEKDFSPSRGGKIVMLFVVLYLMEIGHGSTSTCQRRGGKELAAFSILRERREKRHGVELRGVWRRRRQREESENKNVKFSLVRRRKRKKLIHPPRRGGRKTEKLAPLAAVLDWLRWDIVALLPCGEGGGEGGNPRNLTAASSFVTVKKRRKEEKEKGVLLSLKKKWLVRFVSPFSKSMKKRPGVFEIAGGKKRGRDLTKTSGS